MACRAAGIRLSRRACRVVPPFPLDRQRLPTGRTQLRLTSNLEIYWDRLAVVFAQDLPTVRRRSMPLQTARVERPGFAHRRQTHAQRRPEYDLRTSDSPVGYATSARLYTSVGPVLPLLTRVDDAVAIIGPGEEIQLEFAATAAGRQTGCRRRDGSWSLHGWCKDMDLFTQGRRNRWAAANARA